MPENRVGVQWFGPSGESLDRKTSRLLIQVPGGYEFRKPDCRLDRTDPETRTYESGLMIKRQALGVYLQQLLASGPVHGLGIVNGKNRFLPYGFGIVFEELSQFRACPSAKKQNAKKALLHILGFRE